MAKGNFTKIPVLDLKAQYRKIRGQVRKAIDEVLESQHFILGPAVRRFEEEAASYLHCEAAIGVASGSDALLLSLMALDIGPGDAVLVPPFSFFSSVSCITRLGATPIFVDIDPESCLMDVKEMQALFAERFRPDPNGGGLIDPKSQCRIKAVLPVHLFGQSCAMAPLVSATQKYRLHLVEDVAQAFGARSLVPQGDPKYAGTVGDLGCFSFFPTKNLGGMGDGGLVTTQRKELADAVRMFRVHGQNSRYHHQVVGLNSRLDEIQAAVLSVKLRHVDQWNDERIERARSYRSLFSGTGLVGKEILSLPPLGDGKSHVFNQFVIRVRRRDELKKFLQEHGIQTMIYYPMPLHLQPCFAFLGHHRGDFPKAELASAEVLALPMYAELTLEQQETVVQTIKDFYRK